MMAAKRSARPPVDVFVIGGGPAGAVVGGLLASWGRSVVIAHYETPGPTLAESLPPGTRKLFAFLGQAKVIDDARFHPNDGNVSWWAGKNTITTSDAPGYHVPRAVFDRVLRHWARSAGSTLVDACVRRLDGSGPFELTCSRRSGTTIHRAHVVLDCSGRAGVVARRGLRTSDAGYHTIAVTAEWSCPTWPADERRHTVIESYRDGWAWSVPLSPRRRQCTVMIEPSQHHLARAGLPAVYASELRKAEQLSRRLAGARQASQAWACDASLYHASRAAESGALLVGDAASFVEPLSSAGVKKALMSAWRAAVVANTCLEHPAMAKAAYELHDRRERAVYAEYLRRSAAFFGAADAAYGHPFWSARANAWLDDTGPPSLGLSDAEIVNDPAVRMAFERLRRTAALHLRAGPALRFEPFPSIEGREVVLREAIAVPGLDAPMRFAAGVNLPELARLAPRCRDMATLIEAYRRHVGSVEPAGLLTSLSLLLARHVLLADDTHA